MTRLVPPRPAMQSSRRLQGDVAVYYGKMTAYVLGAGASRHAGYPLCSGLWSHMADWGGRSSSLDPSYQEAIGTIARLNGPVLDLEAVLTDLSLGQGAFASLAPSDLRALTRRAGCCLFGALEAICKCRLPAGCYAALAPKLAYGDAVVTFNYDVALEAELIRAGKFHVRDGYGFDAAWDEPTSEVKLLKLHGSVN